MNSMDRRSSGKVFADRAGRRFTEMCRMDSPAGELAEVQLSPEDAPVLRGWYSAAELTSLGMTPVERAERGEAPETHVDAFGRPISAETAKRQRETDEAFRAGLCAIDNAVMLPRTEATCPCGGAGCRDVTDGALHQCGGPSEACGAPGCPECSTPPVLAGLTPEQARRYGDATATTLRRLAAEYGAAECEASIAYYTDTNSMNDPAARVTLARLSDLRVVRDRLLRSVGCYVNSGSDPTGMLAMSCDDERAQVWTERAKAHVIAALAGDPHQIPGSADLGPLKRAS